MGTRMHQCVWLVTANLQENVGAHRGTCLHKVCKCLILLEFSKNEFTILTALTFISSAGAGQR